MRIERYDADFADRLGRFDGITKNRPTTEGIKQSASIKSHHRKDSRNHKEVVRRTGRPPTFNKKPTNTFSPSINRRTTNALFLVISRRLGQSLLR